MQSSGLAQENEKLKDRLEQLTKNSIEQQTALTQRLEQLERNVLEAAANTKPHVNPEPVVLEATPLDPLTSSKAVEAKALEDRIAQIKAAISTTQVCHTS